MAKCYQCSTTGHEASKMAAKETRSRRLPGDKTLDWGCLLLLFVVVCCCCLLLFVVVVCCCCLLLLFVGCLTSPQHNRPDGLLVKASASRAEDPGFESRMRQDFSGSTSKLSLQWLPPPPPSRGLFCSGSSHTSDFKSDTLMAVLPGACLHRVSALTGRPGVSIL